MNTFTASYIESAFWSSTDGAGEPLDRHYGAEDLAPETLSKMQADCERFLEQNAQLLSDSGITDQRAGFCFWLNRNGHGSGFWDEDTITEAFRQSLSAAAHTFGECDLYVGDDGRIYA